MLYWCDSCKMWEVEYRGKLLTDMQAFDIGFVLDDDLLALGKDAVDRNDTIVCSYFN